MIFRQAIIILFSTFIVFVSFSSASAQQNYCPADYTFIGFKDEIQGNTITRHPLCKKITDMVEDMRWPTKAKATFLLGVLMADRGNYDKAITYFEMALRTIPHDTWIKSTLDIIKDQQVKQAVRKGFGPISRGVIAQDILGSLPKHARDRVLMAMSRVDVGDYRGAMVFLDQARETVPKNKKLQDVKVYISRLYAQKQGRESALSYLERARRAAKVRANGRRDAAWMIGLHISNYGDNKTAASYYKEAQEGFAPDSYHYRLLDQMILNPEQFNPAPEFSIYQSKTDAILDALQYGDSNWKKSINYLTVAYKADPGNMLVLDALNYVEAMSIYPSNR